MDIARLPIRELIGELAQVEDAIRATSARISSGEERAPTSRQLEGLRAREQRLVRELHRRPGQWDPPGPGTASSASPATAVTRARLGSIRGRLESDFARLREEVSAAEEELTAWLSDCADPGGGDEGDLGLRSARLEEGSSVASNAARLLAQTARALARIESGTYGTCESCRAMIDLERLEAFPCAVRCMSCQRHADAHRLGLR